MREIKTYGLTSDQEQVAIDMVENNKREYGNYTLDEVSTDMLNAWIDVAKGYGNSEYAEMLSKAKSNGAEVYTLTDHLGEFSQPLGEVFVTNN